MKPPPEASPRGGEPAIDWTALDRLRAAFLAGTAGERDYWKGESELASYDATFAQRIGWKWDFVLADLQARGWTPPEGAELIDWGCGTGIAARAFLDVFPRPPGSRVRFIDRSPLAMRFAARRANQRFPHLATIEGGSLAAEAAARPTIILVSHVLTELQPAQTEVLLTELRPASAVLWVEPGTYESSLALIAARERLRDTFHPVAPCPHRERCGILAPGNEPHWCHHFARPPGGVFTDPFWGRFAHLVGIDLRSLPLSYLVLDRLPAPAAFPADSVRLIGRPRLLKPEVRLLACRPDGGVREEALPKRSHPDAFGAARKDRFPSVASLRPETPAEDA